MNTEDALEARYWRYLMMERAGAWGGSRKQRRSSEQRRRQFIRRYRAACKKAGRVLPEVALILQGSGGGVFDSFAMSAVDTDRR